VVTRTRAHRLVWQREPASKDLPARSRTRRGPLENPLHRKRSDSATLSRLGPAFSPGRLGLRATIRDRARASHSTQPRRSGAVPARLADYLRVPSVRSEAHGLPPCQRLSSEFDEHILRPNLGPPSSLRRTVRNERVVRVGPGATSDWHDSGEGRVRFPPGIFDISFDFGAAESCRRARM
jgi:hypothetical protein